MEFNETKNADLFVGIDQIINGILPSDVTVVETIKTLSLPRAKNQIHFIESDKFWGSPELFPEQYAIIRDFFELLCPKCNDITRILEKNDVPRNDQVLFEFNKCPICRKHKSFYKDKLKFYDELVGVAGMRSGKTSLMADMAGAQIHDILHIDDIQSKLGLRPSEILDISFMAAGKQQSSDTIYGKFKNAYDRSPWFQNYKNMLRRTEDESPNLRRHDLYRDYETSMYFKNKNLRIKAVPSNAATQAGLTRIMVVLDELAKLDSGESKRSATEVYRVMDHSLLTVRSAIRRLRDRGNYDMPNAIMASISSPMYKHDKSMQLLEDSKSSTKMYSFHKATWEMNPTITKEELDDKFRRDPVGAKRDYGAVPPGAENAFIEDPNMVEACIDRDRPSAFTTREAIFEKKTISGINFGFVKVDILQNKLSRMNEYAIHCDAGETNDSFCMAIGHVEEGTVIIDAGIAVEPVKGEETKKVHFPSVIDSVLEIVSLYSVRYVTYDRWNSTEQIHRIIDKGIPAFGKNLSREDHIDFKESLRDNKIRFPAPEIDSIDPSEYRNVPCARAIFELLILNDNGIKVDHPTDRHNDMIQCYVGVHRLLKHPDKVLPKNLKKLHAAENRRRVLMGRRSIGIIKKLRR